MRVDDVQLLCHIHPFGSVAKKDVAGDLHALNFMHTHQFRVLCLGADGI